MSKDRNKFFYRKIKQNFEKTTLSKFSCYGNINVDVHVTTTLKCFRYNF